MCYWLVMYDSRHATNDVLQVTVVEVHRVSETNGNQQQPNISPALSSFCRNVVRNTLSSQPTPSAVPVAIDLVSSRHADSPACDHISRDLSPCLDTSTALNCSAALAPEPAPRALGDDAEGDTAVECEVGHDGPERGKAAAAGIESWVSGEDSLTTTCAGNVSASGASETCQLAPADTGTASHAACHVATQPTGLHSVSLTEAFASPSAFQDALPPSQISANTMNFAFADTSLSAVACHDQEQVDEHTKQDLSAERSAPLFPMTMKKLQLDKVRQESQVRATRKEVRSDSKKHGPFSL
jgi:hypothetical protein